MTLFWRLSVLRRNELAARLKLEGLPERGNVDDVEVGREDTLLEITGVESRIQMGIMLKRTLVVICSS